MAFTLTAVTLRAQADTSTSAVTARGTVRPTPRYAAGAVMDR